MIVDVHVHTCAFNEGSGTTSEGLLSTMAFRFMRARLGVEATQASIEAKLVEVLEGTPEVDAGVLLAFDAVHTRDGVLDRKNTHLWVTNDYAASLARSQRKVRLGCSVHPYRKDAVAELERCVGMGAVLCKWLPITQGFSPADPECEPFYEALAHHKLPLLCHTGGEKSLPQLRPDTADPALLEGALTRGVTVIMAHCGTRSAPGETDHFPVFSRLVKRYQHCYGDTSALLLPTRWYGLRAALDDEDVRAKLVHGSDWPIFALPPGDMVGAAGVIEAMREPNWLRRDVLIKRQLGFGDEYWARAAKVLRIVR